MARLHRTQILLEKDQYAQLQARAAAERLSLSGLIRRLLRAQLEPKSTQKRPRLRSLAGAFSDPGFSARNHDDVLYSLPAKRRGLRR